MRLSTLDPRLVTHKTRRGVGVAFDCPCLCGGRLAIGITNPLDGGPPVPITFDLQDNPLWWTATHFPDFEKLTLSPSIVSWRNKKQHWHGIISNGEVTTV